MSDIDKKTVENIARLSRIDISNTDTAEIARKLSHIMGWVEKLKAVDVTGVTPMTSVLPMPLKMRQDHVTDGGYADMIVNNAPVKDGHFFCVPKVIE